VSSVGRVARQNLVASGSPARHDERDHHLHAVATLVAAVAEATFVFIIARRIGLEIGARQIIEEHVEGSGEQSCQRCRK